MHESSFLFDGGKNRVEVTMVFRSVSFLRGGWKKRVEVTNRILFRFFSTWWREKPGGSNEWISVQSPFCVMTGRILADSIPIRKPVTVPDIRRTGR